MGTHSLETAEGVIVIFRTRKHNDWTRGTHELETEEGFTCQSQIATWRGGHSQTEGGRERDLV